MPEGEGAEESQGLRSQSESSDGEPGLVNLQSRKWDRHRDRDRDRVKGKNGEAAVEKESK